MLIQFHSNISTSRDRKDCQAVTLNLLWGVCLCKASKLLYLTWGEWLAVCPAAGRADPATPSAAQAAGKARALLGAQGVWPCCCCGSVLYRLLSESRRCLWMKQWWLESVNDFRLCWVGARRAVCVCRCSACFVGGHWENCRKQDLLSVNPWNTTVWLLQGSTMVQAGPPCTGASSPVVPLIWRAWSMFQTLVTLCKAGLLLMVVFIPLPTSVFSAKFLWCVL